MDRFQFCIWLLGGGAWIALPLAGRAQPAPSTRLDTPGAVDMAGRLRMLSQRCAKLYLQSGQAIAAEGARGLLRASIDQFESHLATLQTFQPSAAVQGALPAVQAHWSSFKALLTTPPDKDGAAALYDANENLQQAAHRATVAYENLTGSPLDHLVGIAGRQRMLSQRMAKFFFYRAWNLHHAPADMELHLSRAHFTAVLTQLESSHRVLAPAKAAVVRLRREWDPYQQALFQHRKPTDLRPQALRVAELSESVLAASEELVALLVAQARAPQ